MNAEQEWINSEDEETSAAQAGSLFVGRPSYRLFRMQIMPPFLCLEASMQPGQAEPCLAPFTRCKQWREYDLLCR